MDDARIFAGCARMRRELAGWLSTLSDEQLATPSLCEGWTVRQVAGHLAAALAVPIRSLLVRTVRVLTPRRRLAGLRMVATDLDRSWGAGAQVRGRGTDLMMAVCGRRAVLDRLAGPGAAELATRIPGGAGDGFSGR